MEEHRNDEKRNETDLKTDIKIEETHLEEALLPIDIESSRNKMQRDKNTTEVSKDEIEKNKNTEDAKQSPKNLEESQNEITNNKGNEITNKIASTEDTDQGLSSTNMVETPCSILPKSSSSSQNDDDEPVAKKRRIAASAFLELSEPNTNIDTNVIPQSTAEDIKSYIAYTSNENVPNPFLSADVYEASGINRWKAEYDAELPPNLLEMCRPDKCYLCTVPFTRPIVAKTHYAGKSHFANTTKFLGVWSNMTKQKKPKRVLEFNEEIPEGMQEGWCPVCQLALSSKIVAVSHYKGHRHRKASKRLAETGSAAPVTQVVTAGPAAPVPYSDLGYQIFVTNPNENKEKCESGKESTSIGVEDKFDDDEDGKLVIAEDSTENNHQETNSQNRFFCLPCQNNFTRHEDYVKHMSCLEHKEKAHSQIGESSKAMENYCATCMFTALNSEEFNEHLQKPEHKAKLKTDSSESIDNFLSAMRKEPETPLFWCKPCTLQCSSQVDYDMHCSGKSHFKKVAMQSAVGSNIRETPNTCQSVNVVTVSMPPQLALNIEAAAFKCDACQIVTTDQGGLDMHFQGKKHKKKLNALKWAST